MKEVYAEDLSEAMAAWSSVRGDAADWGDYRHFREESLKFFVESSLREAVNRIVGVGWYVRSDGRTNWRNGTYRRTLVTPYGTIEVTVPRLRNGSYDHRLFDAHGLLTREAEELIRETYLAGCSTRRVGEVLERVLGYRVSASTVSAICSGLDELVRAYWRRELGDDWTYILLDAVVVKSRSPVGSEKRSVLVAKGITVDGRREILSFRQAESESEVSWFAFVEDLVRRGVMGENLLLVCTDGNTGLESAVEQAWPHVRRQRCWVHKLRNLADKMRGSTRKECLASVKQIYQADNHQQAVQRFRAWRARWAEEQPRAVKCLEKDIVQMLEFFALPEKDRRSMRTTNSIERVFREVRRRIRTISCFTNRRSVDRMIYAILTYQNKQWDAAHLSRHKSTHNS